MSCLVVVGKQQIKYPSGLYPYHRLNLFLYVGYTFKLCSKVLKHWQDGALKGQSIKEKSRKQGGALGTRINVIPALYIEITLISTA